MRLTILRTLPRHQSHSRSTLWHLCRTADEGTFGESGFGSKASAILVNVRGKDFRHEKTKKKRGNYKGGTITLASHSIKFSDGEDE